jgi:hypothetical protein
MVNSVQRFYVHSGAFSHRKIAVELVRLLMSWSKREIEERGMRFDQHVESDNQESMIKGIIVTLLIRLSIGIYGKGIFQLS